MRKVYFTITGTRHYFGQEFFKPGMQVRLMKEPENKFDKEAIKVMVDGLGEVGYVANSPCTVIGESMSAGRIYDKIARRAKGRVLYVTDKGVLCVVGRKYLRFWNDPEMALDSDYIPERELRKIEGYDEDDSDEDDDMPF